MMDRRYFVGPPHEYILSRCLHLVGQSEIAWRKDARASSGELSLYYLKREGVVLMPGQPSRTLVEATIDTRRGIAGREDLWGFLLTFRVSPLVGGVEESVRAWVEPAGIQRTVQRHVLGHSDEDTSITTKIDDRPYPLLDEGHRRLREFLYLWTRDVQQVDEQVRPFLERNLWSLRTSREYRPDPHENPLAYAQLY